MRVFFRAGWFAGVLAASSGASAQPVAAANAPAPPIPVAPAAAPGPGSGGNDSAAPGVVADERLAEVRNRVDAAAHSAAEAGLPAEWLLDKVAEGLAKGVPPGRILAAVEHLGARMRVAARIQHQLPPAGSRAEEHAVLRALVDALGVDAPEAAVTRLAKRVARSDPGAVRAGVVAVADLGERGFGGEEAVRAVEVAFEHGGRNGVTRLLASADTIGAEGGAARTQALADAARGAGRPANGQPATTFGRERGSSARSVGPARDRGAARAPAAHPSSKGRKR